jgi:hypothetical protein
MMYTYNHRYGVSAWGASGYWEYGHDELSEDAPSKGWGAAVELNPHGGFHTTVVFDRTLPIPGQEIYMAAAYSVSVERLLVPRSHVSFFKLFSYGGDDIATSCDIGFRTVMPFYLYVIDAFLGRRLSAHLSPLQRL